MTLEEIEAWIEERACDLPGYAVQDAMVVVLRNWRDAVGDAPEKYTVQSLANEDIPAIVDLFLTLQAEINQCPSTSPT